MPEFVATCELPVPAAEAFAWHARPGALERLLPPWDDVRVAARTGGIADGDRVTLSIPLPGGLMRAKWIAEHRDYREGESFQDVQVSGPFGSWEHTHTFHPTGGATCRLEDRIAFTPPLGPLGMAGAGFVRGMLDGMFAFRHLRTRLDLAAHARFADDSPRRILVSGATGLVGSSLVPFLTTGGHEVVRLSGGGQGGGLFAGGVRQDRKTYEVDRDALAANGPYDAVVHLAGESIMGRWTGSKKRAIRDSRVEGTRKLCEALADLDELPEVLVSTSASGIYGDRGDEVLTEESATGPEDDFLADVARDWETAVRPAREAGVRVAHPRIGIVLDPRGGALQKMLPLFKLAAGGRLGAGDQWWSWVAVDDVAGAIHHAILDRGVHGPFNVTAPQPVTNAEFTRVLADVVNRPAFVPVPSFGPKLLLGSELAEALLFASCRVTPQALQTSGYPFRFPDLKSCLTHYLGKTRGVA